MAWEPGNISKCRRPCAAGHDTAERSQKTSALQPGSPHALNTAPCTRSTTNSAHEPPTPAVFYSRTTVSHLPCPFRGLPTPCRPKLGSVQPNLAWMPSVLAWCKPALHYPQQLLETCRTHDILGTQALGLDKKVYWQLGANSADPLDLTHALHVHSHKVKQNPF